jgi:hypothetical protein
MNTLADTREHDKYIVITVTFKNQTLSLSHQNCFSLYATGKFLEANVSVTLSDKKTLFYDGALSQGGAFVGVYIIVNLCHFKIVIRLVPQNM